MVRDKIEDMIKTKGTRYRLICSDCGAAGKPVKENWSAVQCQNPKCVNMWDGLIEFIESNTFGVEKNANK